MANRTLDLVLRYVRRAVGQPQTADPTDGQLLERFAADRDEEAFHALLERHGPMVWGVCGRLLADANDVEDAFQATFLVLVRRARSIAKRESVGSWLHGVARRVAVRACQRRVRDRQRVAAMPHPATSPDSLGPDVRRVLDEELGRLPEKYRAPLVLCYLEGKTNDEAADQLGWTRGTVAGRLSRARELLRGRLSRRGVGIATGALVSTLAPQPAPAALMRATLQAALGYAAGPAITAAGQTAPAIILAEGVLAAMRASKLKVTLAVVLILAMVGVGSGVLLRHAFAAPPADPEPHPAAPEVVVVPALAPFKPAAPALVHRPAVGWTGAHSLIDKSEYLRIMDSKEWAELWKRHVGNNVEKTILSKELVVPEVDFDRFMIVALLDGDSFNCEGFKVFSVIEDNEQIIFRFQGRYFQTAGPDGGAVAVRPYGYFVLPRSGKRLVVERDVQDTIGGAPKWKEVARFEKRDAPALGREKEDAKKDQTALQGHWRLVAAAEEGRPETTQNLQKIKVVIKGDRFTLIPPAGLMLEATFTLDPVKSPKAMDLKLAGGPAKGKTLKAIYAVDGDVLRLCWDEGTFQRPTEFKSRKGVAVLTFRRDSKGDKKPADAEAFLEQEKAKLRGVWESTKVIDNGKEKEDKYTVTVTDTSMIFSRGGKELKVSYTIDPTKKPRTLDIKDQADPKAEIHAAIYDVEGDTLRLCLGDKPGKGRPKDLSGAKNADAMLIILRRKSP